MMKTYKCPSCGNEKIAESPPNKCETCGPIPWFVDLGSYDKLEDEYEEQCRRLSEYERQYHRLREEFHFLEERSNKLEDEYEKQKKELDHIKETLKTEEKTAVTEKKSSSKKKSRLQGTMIFAKTAKTEKGDLDKENSDDVESLKNEIELLSLEKERLIEDQENLESTIKDLTGKIEETSALTTKVENLSLDKQTLRDKIRPLEARKNRYRNLFIVSSILGIIFLFI